MKKFWKIVMLTVLCVSLLCGVTAMAEADRFQFEKTNLTVFEGNTLELSLIRQGNCAADGELTFVSGRENIATVDENGVVTGLTKGQTTITATLKTEKRTWKASVTVTVARAVTALPPRDRQDLLQTAEKAEDHRVVLRFVLRRQ